MTSEVTAPAPLINLLSLRLKAQTLESLPHPQRTSPNLTPTVKMDVAINRANAEAPMTVEMTVALEIHGADGQRQLSSVTTGEVILSAPGVADEHVPGLAVGVVQQELAPYLRELISSNLVRAGFPPFRIPGVQADGHVLPPAAPTTPQLEQATGEQREPEAPSQGHGSAGLIAHNPLRRIH